MCVKEFGYSNGAIQRRLDALKLMKAVPEVESKIEDGTINLSAAASIQSFIQLEERKGNGTLTSTDKLELVEACTGKSNSEIERELARLNPEFVRRESVRPIGEDDMRLTLIVTDSLWRKIERLKALRSHVCTTMKTEELLAWLVEIGLDQADPARKAERAEAKRAKRTSLPTSEVTPQQKPSANRSRYISAQERHAIASKRRNGCDFVDVKTNRRCGSKHFLQRDHIQPYSEGGSNDATNLRWLCGPHNRYAYRNRSRVEAPSLEYLAG